MKIVDWNPDNGDALQGDVCIFRIPDHIDIDMSKEIAPRDKKLILAEGEFTGHFHAIEIAAKTHTGIARLFNDQRAINALVKENLLTTTALAIGLLIVTNGSVVLKHDEHDGIRIPPGRYYVGGQREWRAATARRLAD